jgi:trk system potassium uptake protein TrkH
LDKITPKMSDMAKILYFIYIFITVLEVALLCLSGMSLFDSLINAFGTMGTGGFSNYNASIAHYDSVVINLIIGTFMVIAGANFNLYYDLLKGRWKSVIKDNELRLYLGILLFAVVFIALNLRLTNTYDSTFQAFVHSFFQSSSIMTTTGFASTNFDLWPTFSKMVLFFLMFVGGCSASTAGSIKVVRILVVLKLIKRELFQKLHPRAMVAIKINNSPIAPDKISSILSFVALYFLLFFGGTLLLSIEDFGLVTSASAVAATLGNVGPGFEAVGPIMNYSLFSPFSTSVMTFLMLCGRLELFTVILMLSPGFWRSK